MYCIVQYCTYYVVVVLEPVGPGAGRHAGGRVKEPSTEREPATYNTRPLLSSSQSRRGPFLIFFLPHTKGNLVITGQRGTDRGDAANMQHCDTATLRRVQCCTPTSAIDTLIPQRQLKARTPGTEVVLDSTTFGPSVGLFARALAQGLTPWRERAKKKKAVGGPSSAGHGAVILAHAP